MWYNIGMETETLLAISAGATFLLALGAFWAIWQNRGVQIKLYRHKSLKEIIEWALDISNCNIPIGISGIAAIANLQNGKGIMHSHFAEMANTCRVMIFRSWYIREIILKYKFGKVLRGTVKEVASNLEARIALLGKCADALGDTVNNFDTLVSETNKHWQEKVLESINEVIQEATRLL